MIGAADDAILKLFYAGNLPVVELRLVLLVTFLGSGWMMLGLVPALFLRAYRVAALVTILLLATTAGAVALLKLAVGRVRPCQALAWARSLPIEVPCDNSFPSGHAAGSCAFAFFVLSANRRAGVPLVVLALLIGLSRVALGVHYPSDVLAGGMIGAMSGWTAGRAYLRWRQPDPEVAAFARD